jgi:non-ribosomal peptide synthetase component F
MVGPVANVLPVALDLTDNPSVRVAIQRLRESVIEAFEHQVPFELLLETVGDSDDGVPNVMFLVEEAIAEDLQIDGLTITQERLECASHSCDLAMVIRQKGSGFEGRIEYSTALFEEETVSQMATGYQRLMEVLLSDLDCRIRNLPPILA